MRIARKLRLRRVLRSAFGIGFVLAVALLLALAGCGTSPSLGA